MKTTIDTARLVRNGETLDGVLPVERLPRLASLLATAEGSIDWRARGWRSARPEGGHDDFLELSFSGSVQPACVRCLDPVTVEIGDTRRYRLVDSEAEAERLDPEDDEYDVLAGGPRFDLDALIEDEAILALPPMPRHDHCRPDTMGEDQAEPAEEREKPFAALQRLRRANGPPEGGENPH